MLLTLTLVACSTESALQAIGVAGTFRGVVAVDEPRAAVVARDVLVDGGSAADAAVAAYFTLAVTYPAAVSLGAGGSCLVYDSGEERIEALDFPLRGADGVAVPGAVRAMFALHARYGRLQWSRLLAPAEQLARLGHPVSRALARALAAADLAADAETARLFSRPDGAPLAEGDPLVQLDLAAVLTRLRTLGPARLYGGDLGREVVAAAERAGFSLDIEALRAYQPVWGETAWRRVGFDRLHAVADASGQLALRLWTALEDEGYDGIEDEEGPERLLAAARAGGLAVVGSEALAGKGAGLVAIDADGSAAACTLGLGRAFGVGRVLPGTGIFLGSAGGAPSASPLLLVDHNNRSAVGAVASAAGAAAPLVLAQAMGELLLARRPLEAALAAPRLAPGHATVYAEKPLIARPGLGEAVEVAAIDRLVAVFCPEGFAPVAGACAGAADRRGHGMALTASREE